MFNRLFWGALALAFMSPIGLALAAAAVDTLAVTTPAAASIPIGDWITQILSWGRDAAVMLLLGLGTIVGRQLPAQAGAALMSIWTEKMVGHAIDYAFAAIENATRGQVLTLPQANAVITQAENYVIANAPLMFKLLGGTLRPKIVARLSALGVLPPEANAANLYTARAVPPAAAAVTRAHWLATVSAIGLVAVFAACSNPNLATQIAQDSQVASTVTCALNSGVAVGVAVDSAIDTTKAAAATNTKITNASNALCAGVSTAAKQIVASTPATAGVSATAAATTP